MVVGFQGFRSLGLLRFWEACWVAQRATLHASVRPAGYMPPEASQTWETTTVNMHQCRRKKLCTFILCVWSQRTFRRTSGFRWVSHQQDAAHNLCRTVLDTPASSPSQCHLGGFTHLGLLITNCRAVSNLRQGSRSLQGGRARFTEHVPQKLVGSSSLA